MTVSARGKAPRALVLMAVTGLLLTACAETTTAPPTTSGPGVPPSPSAQPQAGASTSASPSPAGEPPTAGRAEPMTVSEAASTYLSAVCPINANTALLNDAFAGPNQPDPAAVRPLADTQRAVLVKAADQLDSPPGPWPEDISDLIAEMVDQMLSNLPPLEAMSTATTSSDLQQAWDDLAQTFPDDAATRVSKIRLRLGLLGDSDPCPRAPAAPIVEPESTAASKTLPETGPAVGERSQSQRRYALDNVLGSPVYVTLWDYQSIPDGSYTLSVDPWTPDLKGEAAPGCQEYLFYDPDGLYCLLNVTKRVRKVTLLPNADVYIGDSRATVADVWDFVGSPDVDGVVFVMLNDAGYANALVAYQTS